MAQPVEDRHWSGQDDESWPVQAPEPEGELLLEPAAEEPASSSGPPVLAIALGLIAALWVLACAIALYRSAPAASLLNLISWIATMSVPPVLLGLVWLIFGRTSRAETERFTRAVGLMRGEAESLDRVLGIVAERLAANREVLSEDAARLMKLGEEASDRLGRVTHYLSKESKELERKAGALEAAAGQARVDVGVLLADLPQAEQAARSFSDMVREAGMAAHERARGLEAQLSAIAARAQEADSATGGAAERLGAHIAMIESSAGVAAQQLDGTAARLDAVVDGALGRTGEAVDATRAALDAQAQGLFAAIEQGRARFVEAGADASREIAERLDAARQLVEGLDAGLARQEQASQGLVAGITAELAALDERLVGLGERSDAQSVQMATALAGLRDSTATLRQEVDAGTGEAVALVGRAQDMAGALDAVTLRLRDELPPALALVETQSASMREAALSAVAPIQAVVAAAAEGAARLAESEASLTRQRAGLETLLTGISEGVGGIEEQLRALTGAAGGADEAASALVRETGPALIEALVRVREAARVATTHARESIASAIPESANSFAEAVKQAVDAAVANAVREQIAELETASERAAIAARTASERLTRQLMTIGESASALEAKIDEERGAREEQASGGMPRRVAGIIESLNSTAIDVTKILSNEVTDSAWGAYLKGDRGVFTRRAVRLLESGEAREIMRHYDQEPEFREQVNRYINDFEAMLRRVLADSEGNALAVTLLSSDMGKLYVALAQAIQHLRI